MAPDRAIDSRMRRRIMPRSTLADDANLLVLPGIDAANIAYNLLKTAAGHNVAIGTPKQIADTMQEWFESGAADGFNYVPAALPGGIEDFVDMVVPELQRRGLFRTEYEGPTLRQNLGLPIPQNRHTAIRREQQAKRGMG